MARTILAEHRPTLIREAQEGEIVKIVGEVREAAGTIQSPILGKEGVYFDVLVTAPAVKGRSALRIHDREALDFVVEDRSGRALVHTGDMEVVIVRDVDDDSVGDLPRDALRRLLAAHGMEHARPRHLKEGTLEIDERVAVVGRATWVPAEEELISVGYRERPEILVLEAPDEHPLIVSDDRETFPVTDRRLGRVLPVERWPTREEAAAMRWFSPISLGPLTLAERTWVPAMVPWRASGDGLVTPSVLDWYGRFAEGQPGAIVVEATGIRDVPSGPLLRIGDDRFVEGLRELVRMVREASGGRTKLLIQLIDFLAIKRRVSEEKFLGRFLVIDDRLRERFEGLGDEAIRERLISDPEAREALSPRDLESLHKGYRERVTDVHLPHVRELPRALPGLFARAAERAVAAGFDGIELHYAHAYTMASFLSALNTRDDGYGGSREGRARLPLEVFAAVRERVGPEVCVGARFLGDEVIEGGSRVEDAAGFGVRFARAGMDFLSVSKGGKFEDAKQPKVGQAAYPYTGPSGHECMPHVKIDERGPFGRNIPLAAAVRAAVREAGLETPVVGAGGVCSPWQAEEFLEAGHCDVVAAARQTLCDPDWFAKIRQGRGDGVRRCLFTNYCEALDQAHKEVTCQRWDRERLDEPGVALTKDGRRRLVAPR